MAVADRARCTFQLPFFSRRVRRVCTMAVDKQANPAAAPPEEDALVGRTIGGRYRVVGTVGFGGMGRVYDAVQSPLDRHVAIKVLLGGHAHDAAFRRRFMLEAAVTSKLTHPNTVTLFDYGETEGIYFIAMELLKGRTLSDVVRQEGALGQERAIHVAQQICRSLSEAHSQGVIHRDLKPANVMLLQQRHELDFAKVLDERVQSMDELLQRLTQMRSHIASARSTRTPDPLAAISPPGLLNPTPPVAGMRTRPAVVRGTPAGSVPLASISSRVPHNTPRPISARVPHSIPPTPALVQTAPVLAKKRGPLVAVGAALVVAVAVI